MFTSLGRTQENFVYALFGLVSDGVMKVSTQKTTSGPDEKLDTFNAIFSGEVEEKHGYFRIGHFYGDFPVLEV